MRRHLVAVAFAAMSSMALAQTPAPDDKKKPELPKPMPADCIACHKDPHPPKKETAPVAPPAKLQKACFDNAIRATRYSTVPLTTQVTAEAILNGRTGLTRLPAADVERYVLGMQSHEAYQQVWAKPANQGVLDAAEARTLHDCKRMVTAKLLLGQ